MCIFSVTRPNVRYQLNGNSARPLDLRRCDIYIIYIFIAIYINRTLLSFIFFFVCASAIHHRAMIFINIEQYQIQCDYAFICTLSQQEFHKSSEKLIWRWPKTPNIANLFLCSEKIPFHSKYLSGWYWRSDEPISASTQKSHWEAPLSLSLLVSVSSEIWQSVFSFLICLVCDPNNPHTHTARTHAWERNLMRSVSVLLDDFFLLLFLLPSLDPSSIVTRSQSDTCVTSHRRQPRSPTLNYIFHICII